MNSQQTQNALTNQKSSAAYFKEVKTEETFSNQGQKPEASGNYQFVTTTFFREKITTAQIRFCNDR